MSSASFSVTRGAAEQILAAGSQAVTEGTLAPGVGDMELRINLAQGLTKREIKELMDVIFRFLDNPNFSTSNGL